MNSPDRRQFFRESFRSIVKPLAELLADYVDPAGARFRPVLRPPGALPEAEFRDTCYRCGNCVEVCPAHAIRLWPADDPEVNNTPIIDADLGACVICDDLSCMKVCPSGALQLVGSPHDIRMGLAKVHESLCVRTQGEDCRVCIESCPLGEHAIGLDSGGAIEVRSPGCVGCGMCQFHCPTRPRAITVSPI